SLSRLSSKPPSSLHGVRRTVVLYVCESVSSGARRLGISHKEDTMGTVSFGGLGPHVVTMSQFVAAVAEGKAVELSIRVQTAGNEQPILTIRLSSAQAI